MILTKNAQVTHSYFTASSHTRGSDLPMGGSVTHKDAPYIPPARASYGKVSRTINDAPWIPPAQPARNRAKRALPVPRVLVRGICVAAARLPGMTMGFPSPPVRAPDLEGNINLREGTYEAFP